MSNDDKHYQELPLERLKTEAERWISGVATNGSISNAAAKAMRDLMQQAHDLGAARSHEGARTLRAEIVAQDKGWRPSSELPQVPGRAPVTSQESGSRPAAVYLVDLARQLERDLALALDHVERDTKEIERLHAQLEESRRNADDWMQKYGSTQGQSSSKAAPIFRTDPEIRWCNSDEGICGHPTVFDLLQDAEEQLRADKDAAGIDTRINEVPLVKALLAVSATAAIPAEFAFSIGRTGCNHCGGLGYVLSTDGLGQEHRLFCPCAPREILSTVLTTEHRESRDWSQYAPLKEGKALSVDDLAYAWATGCTDQAEKSSKPLAVVQTVAAPVVDLDKLAIARRYQRYRKGVER